VEEREAAPRSAGGLPPNWEFRAPGRAINLDIVPPKCAGHDRMGYWLRMTEFTCERPFAVDVVAFRSCPIVLKKSALAARRVR
jgi:hypothetical protein